MQEITDQSIPVPPDFQKNLREPTRVHLAPERLRWLKKLKEQTGTGFYKLVHGRGDVPEGLTCYIIESWLTGIVKTARRDHLAWVYRAYRTLPDDPRIKVTPGMLAGLEELFERKGATRAAIANGWDEAPEHIGRYMYHWFSGESTVTNRSKWKFVHKALNSLPDKTEKVRQGAFHLDGPKTKYCRHALRETGHTPKAFYWKNRDKIPPGVGIQTLRCLFRGVTTNISAENAVIVLNILQSMARESKLLPSSDLVFRRSPMPPKKNMGQIEVDIEFLDALLKKKGRNFSNAFEGCDLESKEKNKLGVAISKICLRQHHFVNSKTWERITGILSSLPDSDVQLSQARVLVGDHRDNLRDLMKKKGQNASTIFNECGMSPQEEQKYIRYLNFFLCGAFKNPQNQSAQKAFAILEALPDLEPLAP